MRIKLITMDSPLSARASTLDISSMSWPEYCADIIERYRRPGSFGTAGDTRRWRKACRKYGWPYKSAQLITDDAIVIWRHVWNTYRPGLTRRAYQLLINEEN